MRFGLLVLDSHCHLDDPRYGGILEEVEGRRLAVGVRVLVPGVGRDGWARLRATAGLRGWLFAVGTHPERLLGAASPVPEDCAGAAAVGETGLHRPSDVPMAQQIAVLLGHLEVARAAHLPVILHCVRAHDVLAPTIRRFAGGRPIRGVVHSYSGGAALVPVYEALGLHLSFGGAITWKGARRPVEALRRVRPERVLLESDGPDQRPQLEGPPWGTQSEPAMLPEIAEIAARLRGEAAEVFSRQLAANAAELGWA